MVSKGQQVTLFAATLVAFAAGFAAHALWFTKVPEPLSASEARLVGTWRQDSDDVSGQLDNISFLPNRVMLIGNGGMEARWAVENGNLVVHSYRCNGTDWGHNSHGNDEFKIWFPGSSDRLTIDGGVQARAILVRAL